MPFSCEALVFTNHAEVIKGETGLRRTVVLKFDSRDTEMAWYHSPAYREMLPLRLEAPEGYAVPLDGVN